MPDEKKPRLSVVRDSDPAPQKPLPPVPAPIPESQHFRDLRKRVTVMGSSLQDAARLAAIGTVLADGAAEMRPSMSAKAAKAWIARHVENIDRAHLDVLGGQEENARAAARQSFQQTIATAKQTYQTLMGTIGRDHQTRMARAWATYEAAKAPARKLRETALAAAQSAYEAEARSAAYRTTVEGAHQDASFGMAAVALDKAKAEAQRSYEAATADAVRAYNASSGLIDRAREEARNVADQNCQTTVQAAQSAHDALGGPEAYANISDLREAVFGAAAEVDEAGEAAKAPGLVSSLYGVVAKIEAIPMPKKTVFNGEVTTLEKVLPAALVTWRAKSAARYELGMDVLAGRWAS